MPTPKRGEVLVKILTCGVCHTDLHVTEGDLPVHHEHVTPGHEIVGKVVGFGPETQRFKLGSELGFHGSGMLVGYASFVARVMRISVLIHFIPVGIMMAVMQNMSRFQKDLHIGFRKSLIP